MVQAKFARSLRVLFFSPKHRLSINTGLTQSKKSVEKMFLNPSHRSFHHKTHTHTPTHQ